MLQAIMHNIRDFFDMTVFLVMLFIGLFSVFSDYPYFKKQKYKTDASVTFGIGILYLILPLVFLVISKM